MRSALDIAVDRAMAAEKETREYHEFMRLNAENRIAVKALAFMVVVLAALILVVVLAVKP